MRKRIQLLHHLFQAFHNFCLPWLKCCKCQWKRIQNKQIRASLGYLLLAILTALFCIFITPVLATPTAVDRVSQHTTVDSTNPKDLIQQSRALYESGQFQQAIEVLQHAAAAYQAQEDPLGQAVALSNLALVYQQMGQISQASQAIDASLSLLDTTTLATTQTALDRQQALAQTLEIQGGLQLEQGQSEQALATWQQAEAVYTVLQDHSGITRSRINQAQALQILGFYRRAVTTLTDLSKVLHLQPDSLTKAAEFQALGDALQLTGDLNQSREVLQSSLALAQQLQSPLQVGATLLSLGNTASLQSDWSAAISFYQQAIEVTPSPLTRVQAEINLLDVLLATHQEAVAQPLLSQIPDELATLSPNQATLYASIHFAQTLLRQNGKAQIGESSTSASSGLQPAPETIAQLLTATVQQSRSLSEPRAESYALGTLGNFYEQTGQWSNAEDLTKQALLLAQSINAPDIAYRWHWQMGRLLNQQGNITDAITAYETAIEVLQLLRNDLVAVNREVQFSFRDSVEPVYRQAVELLLHSQQISSGHQSNNQSDGQKLNKARQIIEALQIAELDNFFREACLNARTVVLDRLVDQDNPTAAIFYPIILPDQLHVIVKIPQQPLRHYWVNQSQTEIEQLVEQLQQSIVEPDTIEDVKLQAQEIYSWLIQPIELELQQTDVNTLVFVLDGALRSVPMSVLYDGKQYLIEKYAIALSPGLQLIQPEPLASKKLQVLAAGLVQPPPSFSSLPALPSIRSEFDLIAQTGVSITTLLDQDFTSQTLAEKVNSKPFNVIHLATHGQFSSRADETFVLAADGPIKVTQFDTFLRQRDETEPTAVELLVLSACQTAAGDNRATLGLAGATVRAGARSTLASLWNIADRSTAILIGEFYRELANGGVTKAEALRRAQVTLMKTYPNYSRPSFWAAYVLVGNWL